MTLQPGARPGLHGILPPIAVAAILWMPAAAPVAPGATVAPAAPKGTVEVKVEAALSAAGALRGTVTATWKGECARELRSRLAALMPAGRARLLASFAAAPLAGHIKADETVKGLEADRGDLMARYTLEAPSFAPVSGTGKSLKLGLPLLEPYDPKKMPPGLLPSAVIHDIAIELPAGMRPLSYPPAFSSITPEAGRYVLYYDARRDKSLVLIARRELEISGSTPARLDELLQGAAAHDTASMLIVPSKPSGPARP